MKCQNCNKNFHGNFCPYCGTKAVETNISDESDKLEYKQKVKRSKSKYLIIAMCIIIIYLIFSKIHFAAMLFGISTILLALQLRKKITGRSKVIFLFVEVALIVLGVVEWATVDETMTVEYVKQYKDPDVSYSIGEFFETIGIEPEWSVVEKDDAEFISISFEDYEGLIDVVLEISDETGGYPALYDVLINGESNYELFCGFDTQLFGNEDAEQMLFSDSYGIEEEVYVDPRTVYGNDITIYVADVSVDPADFAGSYTFVDIGCYITNNRNTELCFVSDDYFSLYNDGLTKSGYSDYDFVNIESGKEVYVSLRFAFPTNANTDTSKMVLNVAGSSVVLDF